MGNKSHPKKKEKKMKTSIKIVLCVVLVITQVVLFKIAYDKGKRDKQKETEILNLEVHKIG
jgi:hypothetical protein